MILIWPPHEGQVKGLTSFAICRSLRFFIYHTIRTNFQHNLELDFPYSDYRTDHSGTCVPYADALPVFDKIREGRLDVGVACRWRSRIPSAASRSTGERPLESSSGTAGPPATFSSWRFCCGPSAGASGWRNFRWSGSATWTLGSNPPPTPPM